MRIYISGVLNAIDVFPLLFFLCCYIQVAYSVIYNIIRVVYNTPFVIAAFGAIAQLRSFHRF